MRKREPGSYLSSNYRSCNISENDYAIVFRELNSQFIRGTKKIWLL